MEASLRKTRIFSSCMEVVKPEIVKSKVVDLKIVKPIVA
jgi:hypothetical protein